MGLDREAWKFQNTTPTVFIQSEPNFNMILANIVECMLLFFLAIGQILKILWQTWESVEKS